MWYLRIVGFHDQCWLTKNKRIHRGKGQFDARSESVVDSEGFSHDPAVRRRHAVFSLIHPQCQSKMTLTQCAATGGLRRSQEHTISLRIARLPGKIALSWKHVFPIMKVER